MEEYLCPKCGSVLLVMEINCNGYRYKVVCGNCVYKDYIDYLQELKRKIVSNHPV